MQRFNALFVALALAGCSSAPEPPAVDWTQPAETVNASAPVWHETTTVTPSPEVTGHWRQTISFVDDSQLWPPEVWYAVAHSTAITIESPDSATFFRAKAWLRQHGATAVISYHPLSDSLTRQARIALTR